MMAHHIIAAVIAVGVAAPVAYTALDRTPCTEVERAELLTPELNPGGKLRIALSVKRNHVCNYERTSYLYDSTGRVINFAPYRLPATGEPGRQTIVIEETLPLDMPPGETEYYRWGEYRRSAVHEVWPLPPVLLAHVKFNVLPKEKPE